MKQGHSTNIARTSNKETNKRSFQLPQPNSITQNGSDRFSEPSALRGILRSFLPSTSARNPSPGAASFASYVAPRKTPQKIFKPDGLCQQFFQQKLFVSNYRTSCFSSRRKAKCKETRIAGGFFAKYLYPRAVSKFQGTASSKGLKPLAGKSAMPASRMGKST